MSGLTTSESATGGLSPTGSDPLVHPQLRVPDLDVAEIAIDQHADDPNADSWRAEVAARLERYRTRRKPRGPRYPSLLLPFDAPESWSRPASAGSPAVVAATARAEFQSQNVDLETAEQPAASSELTTAHPHPAPEQAPPQTEYQYPELSAKVIEFPRSAAIPIFRGSELAEPVFDFDRPRIVEAPEILPPPPALGGMLIEPLLPEPAERRADTAFSFPRASIARRAMAAAFDGFVVACSLAAFAALVFRLTQLRGPLLLLAGTAAIVAVLVWAAFKYLFVVYTGSTPGLRVARLRLARFDGSPLNRRTRRWRVLTSFLSAFSAGLGYLWCFLDQDGLCWHDRITRTCLTPVAKEQVAGEPIVREKEKEKEK